MNYTPTTNNQTLMVKAQGSLAGKWGIAIGVWFIYMLLINLGNDFFAWEWHENDGRNYKATLHIVRLIIGGPLALGYTSLILCIARNEKPNFEQLFSGFKRFGLALVTYLLKLIFTLLWMLLLIIPGIIAWLRYSQTWYILADNNNISPMDAIRKSKEMMVGNIGKLFCLYCRFIGWFILCIVTLGLAGLYVGPYISVSIANFYEDLKNEGTVQKIDTAPEYHELENDAEAEGGVGD